MIAKPAAYYELPNPPDLPGEWITLKQLADSVGLAKPTVRRYIDDETCPLAFERNADGVIFVERSVADAYFREHPHRGKATHKKLQDRKPVDPDAPAGDYLTLAEAAEEVGYSVSRVRYWVRHSYEDPLRCTHNASGMILILREDLHEYVNRKAAQSRPSSSDEHVDGQSDGWTFDSEDADMMSYYMAYYPDLMKLPGIYITIPQASDALAIGEKTIRDWIHRASDPIPYIRKGVRIFLNKYRLAEFLVRLETEQEQVA